MTGPTFVQIGCSFLPRKRSITCGFKVFWNHRPWKGSNTLRTREGLPHHQKTIDFVWFWLVFQASLGQICWNKRCSLKLAFEEAVHDRFDHFLRCPSPRILYLAIFFGNCTIYFSLVQVLSSNLAYIAEWICDKWEKKRQDTKCFGWNPHVDDKNPSQVNCERKDQIHEEIYWSWGYQNRSFNI